MQSRVFQISDYQFSKDDSLLIDTNIWIFLYARQDSSDKRIEVYSKAWKNILEIGCPVFMDVLTLSEFINTYARLERKANKNKFKDFKEFRNSSDFPPVASAIAVACRKILGQCQRTESFFESVDIDAIFNDYEKFKRDFSDQILSGISRKKQLKVVSDDFDFLDLGVTLLTANRRTIEGASSIS